MSSPSYSAPKSSGDGLASRSDMVVVAPPGSPTEGSPTGGSPTGGVFHRRGLPQEESPTAAASPLVGRTQLMPPALIKVLLTGGLGLLGSNLLFMLCFLYLVLPLASSLPTQGGKLGDPSHSCSLEGTGRRWAPGQRLNSAGPSWQGWPCPQAAGYLGGALLLLTTGSLFSASGPGSSPAASHASRRW